MTTPSLTHPSGSSTTTHATVFLPNVLLDENNYPTWLFRMELFVRGQNLYGFVDGSFPCPPQFANATAETANTKSTDYINWKTLDQSVMNMIGQTLSFVAMTYVVGSKSAKQLWENLRLKFVAPNRQNILQLKSNLQSLKKGVDDIETYLDKIKVARDALETVGVHIDEEDIAVTVLRGLPAEFAAIKTVIRAQFVSCTLGELKTLLKAAEIDIDNESQSSTPLTAMVAHNNLSQVPTSTYSHSVISNSTSANAYVATATPSQTHSVGTSLNSNIHAPHIPPSFSFIITPVQSPIPTVQPQIQTIQPPLQAMVPPASMQAGLQTIPLSTQQPYVSIPTIPYGFSPMHTVATNDTSTQFTGLFVRRGNPRPNNNGAGMVFNGGNMNFGRIPNINPTNAFSGGFNEGTNNVGFNNGGSTSLTCQICNRVGHGARTCRALSNFQGGNNLNLGNNMNFGNNGGCIYYGKRNHTVERCYYIIGFPDQQQNNNNEATAMLAAANNAPQSWLADTGATNHMTSAPQMLNNLTPYNATDIVQIGQGVGQNSLQGTE